MPEHNQNKRASAVTPKLIPLACFVTYRVSCLGKNQEVFDLEMSPFAMLIAASVISENEKTVIEEGFSKAMVNILDSIANQYTITGIKNK
jgi:hypothetical protein